MPLPVDDSYIDQSALNAGINPQYMRRIMKIESGGDPNATTGSYRGLFQLSWPEFKKHGGTGDIYDPVQQSKAAATKFRNETDEFAKKYGRDPTPTELYLVHQQGEGGFAAHYNNPTQPAWKSMLSTGEGKQKGEAWAKKAIWGNIPDNLKKQFGSVDNVTSKDFIDVWQHKVEDTPLGASVKTAGARPGVAIVPTAGGGSVPMAVTSQENPLASKIAELTSKPAPTYNYRLPEPTKPQVAQVPSNVKLVPIDYDPFKVLS